MGNAIDPATRSVVAGVSQTKSCTSCILFCRLLQGSTHMEGAAHAFILALLIHAHSQLLLLPLECIILPIPAILA
jgi:hypothetical protein